MVGLIHAAVQAQKIFDRRKWKYCFISDLAVQKWAKFASPTTSTSQNSQGSDIEGVIAKQGKAKLDWAHVFENLKPLAELMEDLEIVEKLKSMINDFEAEL